MEHIAYQVADILMNLKSVEGLYEELLTVQKWNRKICRNYVCPDKYVISGI